MADGDDTGDNNPVDEPRNWMSAIDMVAVVTSLGPSISNLNTALESAGLNKMPEIILTMDSNDARVANLLSGIERALTENIPSTSPIPDGHEYFTRIAAVKQLVDSLEDAVNLDVVMPRQAAQLVFGVTNPDTGTEVPAGVLDIMFDTLADPTTTIEDRQAIVDAFSGMRGDAEALNIDAITEAVSQNPALVMNLISSTVAANADNPDRLAQLNSLGADLSDTLATSLQTDAASLQPIITLWMNASANPDADMTALNAEMLTFVQNSASGELDVAQGLGVVRGLLLASNTPLSEQDTIAIVAPYLPAGAADTAELRSVIVSAVALLDDPTTTPGQIASMATVLDQLQNTQDPSLSNSLAIVTQYMPELITDAGYDIDELNTLAQLGDMVADVRVDLADSPDLLAQFNQQVASLEANGLAADPDAALDVMTVLLTTGTMEQRTARAEELSGLVGELASSFSLGEDSTVSAEAITPVLQNIIAFIPYADEAALAQLDAINLASLTNPEASASDKIATFNAAVEVMDASITSSITAITELNLSLNNMLDDQSLSELDRTEMRQDMLAQQQEIAARIGMDTSLLSTDLQQNQTLLLDQAYTHSAQQLEQLNGVVDEVKRSVSGGFMGGMFASALGLEGESEFSEMGGFAAGMMSFFSSLVQFVPVIAEIFGFDLGPEMEALQTANELADVNGHMSELTFNAVAIQTHTIINNNLDITNAGELLTNTAFFPAYEDGSTPTADQVLANPLTVQERLDVLVAQDVITEVQADAIKEDMQQTQDLYTTVQTLQASREDGLTTEEAIAVDGVPDLGNSNTPVVVAGITFMLTELAAADGETEQNLWDIFNDPGLHIHDQVSAIIQSGIDSGLDPEAIKGDVADYLVTSAGSLVAGLTASSVDVDTFMAHYEQVIDTGVEAEIDRASLSEYAASSGNPAPDSAIPLYTGQGPSLSPQIVDNLDAQVTAMDDTQFSVFTSQTLAEEATAQVDSLFPHLVGPERENMINEVHGEAIAFVTSLRESDVQYGGDIPMFNIGDLTPGPLSVAAERTISTALDQGGGVAA